jgi:hypothetical protein
MRAVGLGQVCEGGAKVGCAVVCRCELRWLIWRSLTSPVTSQVEPRRAKSAAAYTAGRQGEGGAVKKRRGRGGGLINSGWRTSGGNHVVKSGAAPANC